MLELRAATDLARLWRETGSPNDPRALLEPILAAIEGGEFHEGCPERPRAARGGRITKVAALSAAGNYPPDWEVRGNGANWRYRPKAAVQAMASVALGKLNTATLVASSC